MIYHGDKNIKELYYGRRKIDKVYKGSNLIFENGIPIWRFIYNYDQTQYNCYLLGKYSTQGIFLYFAQIGIINYQISGTIGQPGSYFYIKYVNNSQGKIFYRDELTICGKKLFWYQDTVYGLINALVVKNAALGDRCFVTAGAFNLVSITSITNDSITISINGYTYTFSRDHTYRGVLKNDGTIEERISE